jgi:predicted phage baseplate assembly protein
MPIPLPELDDRTWGDLVAELRSQLPRTAPRWTDHNASDPGITFLELFAWVGELLMYRMDRLSSSTRRAFLRHFGVELRPPTAAHTVVALRLPPLAGTKRLPAESVVTDPARAIRFATTEPVDLSAAWLEQSPDEPTDRGRLVARGSDRITDMTGANRQPDGTFSPFGPEPQAGDCLELALDTSPVDPGSQLRMHVWTETWREDEQSLSQLREAFADWRRHPGIDTVWEYWAGALGWLPVRRVDDQTRALTFTGPVTLAGCDGHRPGPGDSLYRLRCRIVSGAQEYRPRLRRIAINAVPVQHATDAAPLGRLATSRGDAGQTYLLGYDPVVAGSLRLHVGSSAEPWQEVADWDRSGPFDRHVRLDPRLGAVEFGNGRAGLVPPAGEAVTVSGFKIGGGPSGNVPAWTLQRLDGRTAVVVQPQEARGGEWAESIGTAQGRLLDRLESPLRGVTGTDLEALAIAIPGLAVRRARAVPSQHPGYPGLTVPGAVSLVVLTANGTASASVVRAVQGRLESGRPLGCELHVTAPGWRPVSVHATLHSVRRSAPGLAGRAQAALDGFLHPLIGGPEGTGWPFGRDVYRTEIGAVLADVPGVERISDLALYDGYGDDAATCANVSLCPTDLVRSMPHILQTVED